jgi:hypothetical protein
MLELIIAVGETADAAEEGLKVITGMLVVGLISSPWSCSARQASTCATAGSARAGRAT